MVSGLRRNEKLDFVQPGSGISLTVRAALDVHILEQEFILLSEYLKCQH